MSEYAGEVTERVRGHHREPGGEADRRTGGVQVLAALVVGAAASVGAIGAFAPLLIGEVLRGLLVVALLLTGGALAISAPFRLRGWPAAVCGSVASGVLRLVADADLLPANSDGLTAAAAMAAGFAVGGVLSAVAGAAPVVRGLAAGALTAGLVIGTWGSGTPYAAAALAVVAGILAALWVRPPGRVTLAMAPFAALILATVLTTVVVRDFGPYPLLAFLLAGPVLVGLTGWWLTGSGADHGVTERR